ncbi:MAG TPA: riboflavin synthase [bacterium]|nr:riboflavin synthase [bacterium]
MFSGIIEEIGIIVEKKGTNIKNIGIKARKVFNDLSEGDSIAVDGVCLTVEKIRMPVFFVSLSKETTQRTTLGTIICGSKVNLERSLKYGDRVGGHFLSGHIDFVSQVSYKNTNDKNMVIRIKIPEPSLKYFVPQCSVGIDGISLTVAEILHNEIVIWLIPYTIEHTTLRDKKIYDNVNVETDILLKAVIENMAKPSIQRYEKLNKEAVL